MSIVRIEEVTYGVLDLETCHKFLLDFGLTELEPGGPGLTFRTLTNQILRVLRHDDPSLPPAVAPAPTLREIIWGVSDEADVRRLADELGRDRPVSLDPDGVLRTQDETGFSIGFRKADIEDVDLDQRRYNHYGAWNRPSGEHKFRGQARPIRMIHVALDIQKAGREAASDFYIKRLGFKPVENILPTGVFMQCEGETDHHQLFLCHRTDKPGINHIAFEVRDFDEVIEGGNHLVACGWKEARRLGRHTVGSNMFRFFQTPLGGRLEYATDMDQVPKDAPMRTWESAPEHHIWMVKSSGEA